MLFANLTLATVAENLALDEALLDEAEASDRPRELLRLWEPAEPSVVVGRSSRVAQEVRSDACAARQIPVLRRTSGGAAIVTGPGCLMYAVVLSCDLRPALRGIDAAHCFVLSRLVEALGPLAPGVTICGTSDLACASGTPPVLRKFSGNSLRMKRRHLLYHGTLLYDFDLSLVAACLLHPPREPGYRGGRAHAEFVANLPTQRAAVRAALIAAWQADEPLTDWPRQETARLVAHKYAQAAWNMDGQHDAS